MGEGEPRDALGSIMANHEGSRRDVNRSGFSPVDEASCLVASFSCFKPGCSRSFFLSV
jgi:hypothetical protein